MSTYFQGNVRLYNEEFYVNSNTGEGLDRVLKKIDPLLFKMSNSLFIPNYAPEDVKQELAILAIEGVRSYDATKNVKLSTFLHIHLHNKIISKIRSKNKLSNNAFSMSEDISLPSTCDCGSADFKVEKKDGVEISRECTSCDKLYRKEIRTAKKEVLFSEIGARMSANLDEEVMFIDSVGNDGSVFSSGKNSEDELEAEASIGSICYGLDEKTSKILKLISLEDYSIKDAAEEVGLSPWAANLRLKNLSRNKKIRDMLMK
jgi:RNA polymerase sigma factor (sigma-70 family)